MKKENEEILKKLLKENKLYVDVNILQYSFSDSRIKQEDILKVCEAANLVVTEKMTIIDIINGKNEDDIRICNDFAYENFEEMNKEILVLLVINNLISFIERNDSFIKQKTPEFLPLWESIRKEYQKNLNELKLISKEIKNIYSFSLYGSKTKNFFLKILDPRKINISKDKKEQIDKCTNSKLEKLIKINNQMVMTDKDNNMKKEIGLELLLQSIVLTDFYTIFNDEIMGENFRTVVINNALLKRYPYEVIKDISNDKEEYENITKLLNNNDYMDILKELIIESVEYFDIDKFLLFSAYRYMECIEKYNYIKKDEYLMVYDILEMCKKFISTKEEFDFSVQQKKEDTYEYKDIQVSVKEIEETLSRFDKNKERYISKDELKEIKDKIKNMEIDLNEVPEWKIPIVFNENELEEIATLSFENLDFISKYKKWDGNKLFETINKHKNITKEMLEFFIEKELISRKHIENLYCENKISDECFKYLNSKLENINIEKIDEFLKLSKKENLSEDELKEKQQNEKLYKFYINNDEETAKKFSQELMEKMVENYDEKDKHHIEDIEKFYNNGYLNLEDIKEWCGEDVLLNFYKNNILSLNDLIDLYNTGKISKETVSSIANKEVLRDDISLEYRVELINTGLISVEIIEKLNYELLDADLERFRDNNIISEEKYDELINEKTFKQRQEIAQTYFRGFYEDEIEFDIEKLTKNAREKIGKSKVNIKKDNKTTVINPQVRNDYLNILGFVRIKIDKKGNSPFSNYEFYAMPNEKGELTADSIIIAERYFNNKNKEDYLATSNATYFYKFKDLLALSNYDKSEIMKERQGIVYTSSHKIANERKNGSWAKSVLFNVAKTSLGSKLNNINEKEKKALIIQRINEMYPDKKLIKLINHMIDIIDFDDKYLIEL